jgi:hypothetical protein
MPRIRIMDKEGRWNANNVDEFLWWPRVLWIDPGEVSGVAVVWFDPAALLLDNAKTVKVVLAYSEVFLHGPEEGIGGQVYQFLRLRSKLDEEPGLATGIESFIPLKLNQSRAFLAPVRIRAGIEYEMSITKPLGAEKIGNGVPLLSQSPSDAKSAFTNERLTQLGMHTPGPDHVDDAKRHALLHIRRLKAIPGSLDLFKYLHGYEEGWFGGNG